MKIFGRIISFCTGELLFAPMLALLFTGELLFAPIRAGAQNTPDNPDFLRAYDFISKNNVDSALIFIDKSFADSSVRKNATGWYVKGFIYKEAFKKCKRLIKPTVGMTADMCRDLWDEPDRIVTSDHGDGAEEQWFYGANTYLKLKNNILISVQMDGKTGGYNYNTQNPYSYSDTAIADLFKSIAIDSSAANKKNCGGTIKFLAGKNYTHAATLMDSLHYATSVMFFRKYIQTMKRLDPSINMSATEISYNRALGEVYSDLFFNSKSEKDRKWLLDSSKKAYNTVLSINPNDVSANYNLAILYYNQAVYIINNMDYDVADLRDINAKQDTSIGLAKQSLPYMEKTYKLDPKKKDAIKGLKGIYYLLHDTQKFEEYDQKLRDLEGKD